MSGLHSVFVRVAGLRMHALAGGLEHPGPPLVLVHGLAVSSAYFVPLARELARDRRVLAPDLPGSGRSGRPPDVPGITGLADALGGWLDALALPPAAFVANSLGCQVVVDLAVRDPARASALVLVGPTVDPRARSAVRQGTRLLLDSLHEPPDLVAIVAREYAAFGVRRLLLTGRSALADRIEGKLPLLAAPTLVVRGERDGLVPQPWAEEAASLLRDGRLAVVPGAHACHYTAPGTVAELVRALA